MVELQIKGKVASAEGDMSTDEWLIKYVNKQRLDGDEQIQTTWGKKETISKFEACLVFSPEKKRGSNGVQLKQFLGVGNVSDLCREYIKGFKQDLAFFPLGIPREGLVLHNDLASQMIGMHWRNYQPSRYENKWTLLAVFNVLQHFFYHGSTNIPQNVEYVNYLREIYDKQMPRILNQDDQLQQIVYSQASSLQSNDVLHTMLSLGLSKQNLRSEYKQLNKKHVIEQLIKQNVFRQQKYSQLRFDQNLSEFTGLLTLLLYSPLMIHSLNQNEFDGAKVLKEYEEEQKLIIQEQKKYKNGVEQFVVIMMISKFCKYFSYEDTVKMWCQSFNEPVPRSINEELKRQYDNKRKEITQKNKQLGMKRSRNDQDPEEEKESYNKRQKTDLEQNNMSTAGQTDDGLDYQFRDPFLVYSTQVSSVAVIQSTFPQKLSLVVLPEEGFYKILLHSTLQSQFFGKFYENDNHVQSEMEISFCNKSDQNYRKDKDFDSFSVTGLWNNVQKGKIQQVQPLKNRGPQSLEFSIAYINNQIYICQDNMLYIKLKADSQKQLYLGLNGSNCTAIIHRSNISENNLKSLDQIDTKTAICSICFEKSSNSQILKCNHEFCKECISDWLRKHNKCPICRQRV
eukprot:403369575